MPALFLLVTYLLMGCVGCGALKNVFSVAGVPWQSSYFWCNHDCSVHLRHSHQQVATVFLATSSVSSTWQDSFGFYSNASHLEAVLFPKGDQHELRGGETVETSRLHLQATYDDVWGMLQTQPVLCVTHIGTSLALRLT